MYIFINTVSIASLVQIIRIYCPTQSIYCPTQHTVPDTGGPIIDIIYIHIYMFICKYKYAYIQIYTNIYVYINV